MRYILNVFAGNLSLSTVPPLRLWHKAADSTGRTASGRSLLPTRNMRKRSPDHTISSFVL